MALPVTRRKGRHLAVPRVTYKVVKMRRREEVHEAKPGDLTPGEESEESPKADPHVSERVVANPHRDHEKSKNIRQTDPTTTQKKDHGSKDQPRTVSSKRSHPSTSLEEGKESTSTAGKPESGTGETPPQHEAVVRKGKEKVQRTSPVDAGRGQSDEGDDGCSQGKSAAVAESAPEDRNVTHPPVDKGKATAQTVSHQSTSDEEERPMKKPRLVWTPELHNRFMNAVNHLGIKNAVPKTILQLMNVEGMTRENVASHLQKYRLFLKRTAGLPPNAALPQDTAVQVPFVHKQSAEPSTKSDRPRARSASENASPTMEGDPSPAPEGTTHSYPPFMGMHYGSHFMPPFPMGMGMGLQGQGLQSFYPFGGIPWWTGEPPGERADPRYTRGSQPPEEKNGTS